MESWNRIRGDEDIEQAVARLRTDAETCRDSAEKARLLEELARVQQDVLCDLDAAIATYERVAEMDPSHEGALAALEVLYTNAAKWGPLVHVLERLDRLSTEPVERACRQLRIAALAEEILEDPARAKEAFRTVLSLDPENQVAREGLVRLGP